LANVYKFIDFSNHGVTLFVRRWYKLRFDYPIEPLVKVVMWSRGGLIWRSQVGANPITIPHSTNLALFGHKITLYRFNRGEGGLYYCRGLKSEQGAEPPGPLTLTTALDCDSTNVRLVFNSSSTALRPFDNLHHDLTWLMHCGLNKQIGQRYRG